MNQTCRISVRSTRNLCALDFFQPAGLNDEADPPEDDWEDWEDWDEDEEDDPEEEAYPTDRWSDPETPPPPLPASTVLTTYGIFSHEEDGSWRISYEDSEVTGLEGCLTTFCLAPTGMLIMLRRGAVKTCMVFEEAHRHLCDYGAAAGAPSVTLHTHRLKASLNENGGSIRVDYSVELRGSRTEEGALVITVEKVA